MNINFFWYLVSQLYFSKTEQAPSINVIDQTRLQKKKNTPSQSIAWERILHEDRQSYMRSNQLWLQASEVRGATTDLD
jgi:hypothetical protein